MLVTGYCLFSFYKYFFIILISGLPNILTVRAINSVGLKQTVYTTSLTVDTTPPGAGQVCILSANYSTIGHAGTAARVVHRPFCNPQIQLRLTWPRGCFENCTCFAYALRALDAKTKPEAEAVQKGAIELRAVLMAYTLSLSLPGHVPIFFTCKQRPQVQLD